MKIDGPVVAPPRASRAYRDPSLISPRESAPRMGDDKAESFDAMPVRPDVEGVRFRDHGHF